MQRMLKCLSEIGSHRGCRLSKLGEALANTLQSDSDALQSSCVAHDTELETDEQPAVVQNSRRFECLVMQYPEQVPAPTLHYAELQESDQEESGTSTMQLMERILELGGDIYEHPWRPCTERGKILFTQWNQLSSQEECSTAQRRALVKETNDVLDALQQVTEANSARVSKG